MIPLEHPLVQDYLRAARANPHDASIPRIMLGDRLSEEGRFPFLGEPGGLGLGDLCWWYAKGRKEDEPALRLALWIVDEMLGNGERSVRVREEHIRRADLERRIAEQPDFAAYVHEQALAVGWYGSDVTLNPDDPVWMRTKERARAAAIKDMQRRVLMLYPEIRYKVSCRISDLAVKNNRVNKRHLEDAVTKSADFLPHLLYRSRHDPENRCTEFWQDFTASDLLPPDNWIDARWQTTNSTPLDDLRAMRDRIYREELGIVQPLLRPDDWRSVNPVDNTPSSSVDPDS